MKSGSSLGSLSATWVGWSLTSIRVLSQPRSTSSSCFTLTYVWRPSPRSTLSPSSARPFFFFLGSAEFPYSWLSSELSFCVCRYSSISPIDCLTSSFNRALPRWLLIPLSIMLSMMKGSSNSSFAVGRRLLSTVRHLVMKLFNYLLHFSGSVSPCGGWTGIKSIALT